MSMTNEQRSSLITALIEERRGYEVRNDEDKMAQVDEELRKMGHEGATPAQRAEKRPARQKAETR